MPAPDWKEFLQPGAWPEDTAFEDVATAGVFGNHLRKIRSWWTTKGYARYCYTAECDCGWKAPVARNKFERASDDWLYHAVLSEGVVAFWGVQVEAQEVDSG